MSATHTDARLAAVESILPEGCWATRSEVRCTTFIGHTFGNGARWSKDLCCLPCLVRAALSVTAPDGPRSIAARVESCRMVSPRVSGPCGRDAGHDGPHRSTGDTFTAYWERDE